MVEGREEGREALRSAVTAVGYTRRERERTLLPVGVPPAERLFPPGAAGAGSPLDEDGSIRLGSELVRECE